MASDLTTFLASSDVIDWEHPKVNAMAASLRNEVDDPVRVARRCSEWVRDEIQHTVDFDRSEVTCSASEVLRVGTGFCYSKSHLLAALLRANQIPAGFCYQRLGTNGMFCLHGLVAVHLPSHGWYRVDCRGDKEGIATDFSPP